MHMCSNNIQITKNNTLFIIDWDDTILASNLLRADVEKPYSLLIMMNEAVENLLNTLRSLGNVIIVTSSRDDWVKLSAVDFFNLNIRRILNMIDIYYVDEVLLDLGFLHLINVEDKKSFVFEYVIEKHLIKSNYFMGLLSLMNPINLVQNSDIICRHDLNVITLGDGMQESNAFFYIQQRSKKFDNYNLIYKHIEYMHLPSIRVLIEENLLVKKIIETIRDKKSSGYYRFSVKSTDNKISLYTIKMPLYFVLPKSIGYYK
jgi:hypothetical protein